MALEKLEDADITLKGADDKPMIRISFEFDSDVPEDVRHAFVAATGIAIANVL